MKKRKTSTVYMHDPEQKFKPAMSALADILGINVSILIRIAVEKEYAALLQTHNLYPTRGAVVRQTDK
jgi:hypothetical protein